MKKLTTLSLLICSQAFAYDVGTNYNSANMSYPANSTISQIIVFNSAMQAGGTINFVVDAHAGGGRPLQHDTGQLKIQFFNASGTILGTAQTTYATGNLAQMNAWSSAPGDNTAPWSTLSLSTTNCGTAGSCSSVAYMKIIMEGTDTSWWAGNYGPQWRLPTVTFNGGTNLVYNPEFGNYGSTMAQGWTSSSGWGACGTTSGSVMCTTSASGVTANISGGGYDAAGGSTSGTSGGYSSTLTTSDANAGTGGGSSTTSSAPTVTGTSTTYSTSTSSSSSNTSSVTVTRPTTTGNYTDVFVGTTTVTTTTTTPVTTTTYSDGTSTTSNGSSTSSTSTTYTITPTTGTAPVYTRLAPNISGNSVYVKQIYSWNNTQVSITQEGNNNAVTGTDTGWATVDGNGSIISIQQYGQGNIVGTKMNAWGNNIDIKQKGETGADVNNNIFNLESFGNGNSVTLQQQSNANTASVKMTYDINTANITQKGGTSNSSYTTINGNWNTVNNTQNGTGNFSLVNITGDQNSATVNQTGTNHSTLLNLINAGGANSVSVIQTGTGDTYSLQQTCTNPAGCSVSVVRNR